MDVSAHTSGDAIWLWPLYPFALRRTKLTRVLGRGLSTSCNAGEDMHPSNMNPRVGHEELVLCVLCACVRPFNTALTEY